MMRRPPSATRTDTLFPYTTLFRSHHSERLAAWGSRGAATRRSWSVPCVDPRSAGPARAEPLVRSEEHTSELQSLMRISYAVFCLNKKTRHCKNTYCLVRLQCAEDIRTIIQGVCSQNVTPNTG